MTDSVPNSQPSDAAASPATAISLTTVDAEAVPDTDSPDTDSSVSFGLLPPALGKPPQPVVDGVVAFPPNRATLGGTAYLITTAEGNLLVDCPPWTVETQNYLSDRGVRWLFITHRNGLAQVKTMQAALNFEIVIQEQEAYLLPGLEKTTFGQEINLAPGLTGIWTSGYSPGSACLHWAEQGGILFTGRHLLPTSQRNQAAHAGAGLAPLRTSKTFHWPRQLRAVQRLQERFPDQALARICPGASIGFLRGERSLNRAGQRLQMIDLKSLAQAPIGP